MKVKRFLSLLLSLCMSFTFSAPVFAMESESVEIAVNDEQDILEFIFSDEFDPSLVYSFVYPDSPISARILCPECGYNTLVGKTVERYDLCHPSSQGMTVQCPDFPTAPDAFYVMLVYAYTYCNTCGYKGAEGFYESKYYIFCTLTEESYVATNFKTDNRLGCTHEWKDTWSLYYDDPHAA